MKIIIINIFLLCLFTNLNGQSIQLGLSANLNTTFFHKAYSKYDDHFYKPRPSIRFGSSVPLYIDLKKNYVLKTGIGWQIQTTRLVLDRFDFPDFNGKIISSMTYSKIEIPLLICYKKNWKKNLNIEYSSGCILSLNYPFFSTAKFSYEISSASIRYVNPELNLKKTFSSELYVGLSLIKNKNNSRRHQVTLSYQYSINPTTKYHIATILTNSSMTKEYKATIRPRLSCIIFSYTFFPKWLSFKPIRKN
jgi:hypothetical protein